MRLRLCLLLGAGALVVVLGVASSPALAEPCAGDILTHQYDYRGDVRNRTTDATTTAFADLDLIELRTCLSGGDIVVGLRTAGPIAAHDPEVEYGVTLDYLDGPFTRLSYSNGVAEASFFVDRVGIANATSGAWLELRLPANYLEHSPYENSTHNWSAEASCEHRSSGWLHDWSDVLDLRPGEGEVDDTPDLAAEVSPFASPTVTITALEVIDRNGSFEVRAEGAVHGDVAEIRASLGFEIRIAGYPAWGYYPFWIGEAPPEPYFSGTLRWTPGSSDRWQLTFNYTEEQLFPLTAYSSYYTPGNARIEVRALTAEGQWGHANHTFEPFTAGRQDPPSSTQGGVLGAFGTNPLVLAAVVGAGGAGAAVAVRAWRRKRSARPPVLPPPP